MKNPRPARRKENFKIFAIGKGRGDDLLKKERLRKYDFQQTILFCVRGEEQLQGEKPG
jgi:hypothetical protein